MLLPRRCCSPGDDEISCDAHGGCAGQAWRRRKRRMTCDEARGREEPHKKVGRRRRSRACWPAGEQKQAGHARRGERPGGWPDWGGWGACGWWGRGEEGGGGSVVWKDEA
eukprot:356303-Chlamydomonas_euryale.AAC.2